MTKEAQLTKEQQHEVYVVDVIAQMCYQNKINIDYLDMAMKFLKPCNLKDAVLFYKENQQNHLNKMLRYLRGYNAGGINIAEGMQKDMEGFELHAMFDIIRHLKSTMDIEGVADLVTELKDLGDIEPIKANLIALIRNEKNRQGC